jgi:hypothetical protein
MMQIKFVAVSEDELEKQRAAFASGQLSIEIEDTIFDLAAYSAFLSRVAPEARAFRDQQLAASQKQVGNSRPSLTVRSPKCNDCLSIENPWTYL